MTASVLSFDRQELQEAARQVHSVMAPTPQYAWPKLARRTGCTVWVKHENHTPTGAFKVRGGITYLHALLAAEPGVPGVITATRGNHGQSISYAAARARLPATIYVPFGNSPDQNASIAAFGAKLVEHGRDFDEARQEAQRVASLRGLHFVPSFHRNLVAGVASCALEFLQAAPQLDVIYVGIGMGSGICALMAVRDLLGLPTQIVGVCAARAPSSALSFTAGRPVPTPSALTFADGLATREPDPTAIATLRKGAARVVEVSEDAIAEAMRIYFDDTHQAVEGAGAAPLAAFLQERGQLAGKHVGLILSGGNIERARFLQVLSGQTPAV